MIEIDAIKLSILHLDGEAQERWYHGLVPLGHDTTTLYSDFIEKLMRNLIRGILIYILESYNNSNRLADPKPLYQSFQ